MCYSYNNNDNNKSYISSILDLYEHFESKAKIQTMLKLI